MWLIIAAKILLSQWKIFVENLRKIKSTEIHIATRTEETDVTSTSMCEKNS